MNEETQKELNQLKNEIGNLKTELQEQKKLFNTRFIKKLVFFGATAAALAIYAATISKPHTFSDGDVASASAMNENFDVLYSKINEYEGKSWRLIYNNELTSALTTINISNLNGNSDVQYMITSKIQCTGSANFWLTFNNDGGNNYGQGQLRAESSTATASTQNAQTRIFIGDCSGQNFFTGHLYAKSGFERSLNYQMISRSSGSAVARSHTGSAIWSNTSDNLTSIEIFSDNGNAIGTGSHFQIWAIR